MFLAADIYSESILEYSIRAHCCAGHAENAFRREHSFTIVYILHDIYVHRTGLVARAALSAFLLVSLNLEEGES